MTIDNREDREFTLNLKDAETMLKRAPVVKTSIYIRL